MTQAVATQDTAVQTFTDEQVELIKNTIAKGATSDELQLFLYTSQRVGLDPLIRQIHFVKRGGQMTIQTGIDGYRAVAERSGTLAGIDDAVYDREDRANPNKATVTVWRWLGGNRVSFTASARWAEYAPEGSQGFMWRKMPYLMLGKCAEALALRKAFPNDLSGIYTKEEMAQAEKVPATQVSVETERKTAELKERLSTNGQIPEEEPVTVQGLKDEIMDLLDHAAIGDDILTKTIKWLNGDPTQRSATITRNKLQKIIDEYESESEKAEV